MCCVGDRETSFWLISLLAEYCIAGERITELEGLPQHFIKQQHHNHLLAPSLGNSWGQIGVFSLGCVWRGGYQLPVANIHFILGGTSALFWIVMEQHFILNKNNHC
jgi:hypothetical protein